MKCQIPQISWHSRDPVLSIDFQPCKGNRLRLASGGTDSHVLIWYVTYQENKSINIECASDLYRHNKSVNVVRFSPNGDLLASGDDEGALFLWQLKERDGADAPKDDDNINQEEWYPLKLLRGHLEDIYDISWSADGNFLVSASMDNTAIMWDMQKFQKVHIFSDSKGYVQGVAWDPLNMYICSIGTDRALRIININYKKTAFKVQRAPWTVTTEKGTFRARLFYDDTLKSYFRRLCFTPDGELLIVPSGILEKDDKLVNTTYIFSRHSPNKPVAYLPTGDKYTVAVRCSPLLYKLRSENKENQNSKYLLNLPYRMVFAVAASDSVLIYDTEQLVPIAYVSNIHYTHLTDLTCSADGRILVASSTDVYCSFIIFNDEELGEVYIPPVSESPKKEEPIKEPLQTNLINQIGVEEIKVKSLEKANDKEVLVNSISENTALASDKKSIPISPKEIQTPIAVKPKKPKLTIESFFASPKNKPAVTVAKQQSSQSSATAKNKVEDVLSSKITQVNASSTPTNKNVMGENEIEICVPAPASKEGMLDKNKKLNENVPMEIEKVCDDSCSIEIVCELKNSTPVKKNPNCKVQLDFANKVKLSDSSKKVPSPDLSDSAAVASFGEINQTAVGEVETENDWKLELSQDEEIVPMDTTEPSTSKSEVKLSVTETTPKPKRRINLITLSKTVTKTPPKE